jgi:hypothetical protein
MWNLEPEKHRYRGKSIQQSAEGKEHSVKMVVD